MATPFNIVTTDAPQTIYCPGTTRINLQVSNAAIAIAFGVGLGGVTWPLEEVYLPVIGGLARVCDAIRIRSLTAGQPAVVIGTALGEGD